MIAASCFKYNSRTARVLIIIKKVVMNSVSLQTDRIVNANFAFISNDCMLSVYIQAIKKHLNIAL